MINPGPIVVIVPPATGTGHGGRHHGHNNHQGQAHDTARG